MRIFNKIIRMPRTKGQKETGQILIKEACSLAKFTLCLGDNISTDKRMETAIRSLELVSKGVKLLGFRTTREYYEYAETHYMN